MLFTEKTPSVAMNKFLIWCLGSSEKTALSDSWVKLKILNGILGKGLQLLKNIAFLLHLLQTGSPTIEEGGNIGIVANPVIEAVMLKLLFPV